MICVKEFFSKLSVKLSLIIIIGLVLSLISGRYSILTTSFFLYFGSLLGSIAKNKFNF